MAKTENQSELTPEEIIQEGSFQLSPDSMGVTVYVAEKAIERARQEEQEKWEQKIRDMVKELRKRQKEDGVAEHYSSELARDKGRGG